MNIASRLESTNKSYGSTIIIGEATRRMAGERIVVRELDRLAVYGRAGGLRIYELLGMAGECDDKRDWIAAYEAGLAAWRAGGFADAIGHFEQARTLNPRDAAASLMIERCRHQIDNPTAEGWDGTTVARTK